MGVGGGAEAQTTVSPFKFDVPRLVNFNYFSNESRLATHSTLAYIRMRWWRLHLLQQQQQQQPTIITPDFFALFATLRRLYRAINWIRCQSQSRRVSTILLIHGYIIQFEVAMLLWPGDGAALFGPPPAIESRAPPSEQINGGRI